jgi:nucleotide-binding universal stress UspA family protein
MEPAQWIVVGTDFSDGAARALCEAIRFASRIGASVACVHAYEDMPGTPLLEDREPALAAQLEETIAVSGAHASGVHVQSVLRRGPAWQKLLNVACERGASLIVVGAHGQLERPNQFFLGSVASRLAALSTRMVLIVPSALDQRGAA